MKRQLLYSPTLHTVIEAGLRFDADDYYGPADGILSEVLAKHPGNANFDDVLLKVALLNSLYTTKILAFWEMAHHIHTLKIDATLAQSDPELVCYIARLTAKGKTRRNYSFATKYCSWHRPDEYPIYDSRVERVLVQYRDQFRFARFSEVDLRDYPKFKAIVAAFRDHFSLQGLTFKQLDKFLDDRRGIGGCLSIRWRVNAANTTK